MDAVLTTKYDKALELALLSLAGDNLTGLAFDMEAYNRAIKISRVINEPAVLDAVKYVDSCASRAGYIVGIDALGDGELYLDIVWDDDHVSSQDIQAFLDAHTVSDDDDAADTEVKETIDEGKTTDANDTDRSENDKEVKNEEKEKDSNTKENAEDQSLEDDNSTVPELSIDRTAVAHHTTIMGQSVRTFLANGTFPSNTPVEISIGHGNHYSLNNFYIDQKATIVNLSTL